jgi:hypothetical protein
MNALGVSGEVDAVHRLHRDPPAEYENTAWAVVDHDGAKKLIECAIVECPDCEQRAYWKAGVVACDHCKQRQRLIG